MFRNQPGVFTPKCSGCDIYHDGGVFDDVFFFISVVPMCFLWR